MTKPAMQAVESSNVDAIGYSKGNLYIDFKDGGSYKFKDVPQEIFTGIQNAGSAGKYFHAQIKGKFESEKLSEGAGVDETAIANSPEALKAAQSTGAPAPIVDDNNKPHPLTAGENTTGTAGNGIGASDPQAETTGVEASEPRIRINGGEWVAFHSTEGQALLEKTAQEMTGEEQVLISINDGPDYVLGSPEADAAIEALRQAAEQKSNAAAAA